MTFAVVSRRRAGARASVAAAMLCAMARAAGAQSGEISAVAASSDHSLMKGRLTGAAARVRIPVGDGGLSIRAGAEHLAGTSWRTGAPCGGFIQPGTCPPEPLRDEAHLVTLSGGLGVRVLSRWRFTMELTGDLRFGAVQADTRGLTSGGTLSAGQTVVGAEVGVEGAWSPVARVPLALEAGLTTGQMLPFNADAVLDGYTPFAGGFGLSRLRVGLAWRLR